MTQRAPHFVRLGTIHRRLVLTTALAGGMLIPGAALAGSMAIPGGSAGAISIRSLASAAAAAKLDLSDKGSVSSQFGAVVGKASGGVVDISVLANKSLITWKDFNIPEGDTVNFKYSALGPGAVLNRVVGSGGSAPAVSQILGNLNAPSNLQVYIINTSGIIFGNNATVNVGGLVASSLDVYDKAGNQIDVAHLSELGSSDQYFHLGDTPTAAQLKAAISVGLGTKITTTGKPTAGSIITPALPALGDVVLVGTRIVSQSAGSASKGDGISHINASSDVAIVAAEDVQMSASTDSPLSLTLVKGSSVGSNLYHLNAQVSGQQVTLALATRGSIIDSMLVEGTVTATGATATKGGVILTADKASGAAVTIADGADINAGAGIQGSANINGAHVDITAAGAVDYSGALNSSAGNVTVASDGNVTLAGNVTAVGNYAVTGAAVTLGATGDHPVQKATGKVAITSTSGALSGISGLTLQSNSGGVTDTAQTRDLELVSAKGIAFSGTTLLGGTATRRSNVGLSTGATTDTLSLGTVTASALGTLDSAGDFTNGLSRGAGITIGALDTSSDILLKTTGPTSAISTGTLTSGGAIAVNSGGALSTGLITTTAKTGGTVALDSAGAMTLAGINSTGAVTIGSTVAPTTLTVNGTLTSGGALSATSSGTQTYKGDVVSKGGALALTTTGAGGIAVTGAVTSAGTVGLKSGGTLSTGLITTTAKTGGTVALDSAGAMTLAGINSTGAVTIGSIVAPTTLTVNGNLTSGAGLSAASSGTQTYKGDVTTTGGAIALQTTGSGDVAVTGKVSAATTLAISAKGGVKLASASGSTVTIDAAKAIAVSGAVTAKSGAAVLTGNSISLGGLSANSADLNAVGPITLSGITKISGALDATTSSATLGDISVSGTTTAGAITLNAARDLSLSGATTSSGAIALTSARDVALGGTLTGAHSIGVRATGGKISGADKLSIASLSTDATDHIVLEAGGPGGIALGGSTINAGTGRAIDLVIGLDAASAPLTLGAVNARGLLSLTTAGGNPATDVGGLAAGGAITLGNLVLTSGLSANSTTGGISATSITSAGDIALDAAGSISVSGNVQAGGAYSVTAKKDVTLGGSGTTQQTAVNGVTIAAGGQITGQGKLSLQSARNGGTAMLVLDAGGLVDFGTGTTLQGGNNESADVGVRIGAGQSLTLGTVDARSLQSVDATHAILSPALAVSGDVTLGNTTLAQGLNLSTGGGSITTQTVTITGAGQGIDLQAAGIDANGALVANGAINLTSTDGIDFTSILSKASTVKLSAATAGAVSGTSVEGTGVSIAGGATDIDTVTSHGNLSIVANGLATLNTVTANTGGAIMLTSSGLAAHGGGRSVLTADGNIVVDAGAGQALLGKVHAGNAVTMTAASLDASEVDADQGAATLTASNGNLTVGPVTAAKDVVLSQSGVGSFSAMGTLTGTAGNVVVTSVGDVAIGQTVIAGGAYQVTGRSVTLGKAGASVTQSAANGVSIVSTDGAINGVGTLTLNADTNGNGGGDLILNSSRAISFGTDTTLLGGANGTAALRVALGSGDTLALGTVNARSLVSWDAPLTATTFAHDGAVSIASLTVLDSLSIALSGDNALTIDTGVFGNSASLSTGGSARLGNVQAAGPLSIVAGGDITGLAQLSGGFGQAVLTSSGGAITLSTTESGDAGGAVDVASIHGAGGVDVRGRVLSIGSATSDTGGVTLVARSYDGTATHVSLAANTVQAAGAIDIESGAGSAALSADNGAVRLDNATSQGGNITLAAAGGISGRTSTGATLLASAADSDIATSSGTSTFLTSVMAGRNVTVTAGAPDGTDGTIQIGGATASGGALTLTAYNSTGGTDAGISLESGEAGTGATVKTVGQGDVTIGTLDGGLAGPGSIAIGAAGAIRADSIINHDGALALTAAGDLSGRLSGNAFGRSTLQAQGGDLIVTAGAATIQDATTTGNATFQLASLDANSLSAGGTLALTTTGTAKATTLSGSSVNATIGSVANFNTILADNDIVVAAGSQGADDSTGAIIIGSATAKTGSLSLTAYHGTGAGPSGISLETGSAGGGAVLATGGTGDISIGTLDSGQAGSAATTINSAGAVRADRVTNHGGGLVLTSAGGLTGRASGGDYGRATLQALAGDLNVTAKAAQARIGEASASGATSLQLASLDATTVAAGKAAAIATTGAVLIGDTLSAGTGLTVDAGGAATLNKTTAGTDLSISATALTLNGATSAGQAASIQTSGDMLAKDALTVGNALTINAGGTATLDRTAVGGNLAVTARDANLNGAVSAANVLFTNLPGTGSMQLGDPVKGASSGTPAIGSSKGFTLSGAEINRISATGSLTFADTSGTVQIGDLALNASAGRSTFEIRTAGRLDVYGALTAADSPASRTIILGGDGTDGGLSKILSVVATANGGGRIDIGKQATLDLRAETVGVGENSGFLDDLGVTNGNAISAGAVATNYVSQSTSSLYNSSVRGQTYTNPTLIQAGRMVVHYSNWALFQNTGQPGTDSGVVLGNAGSSLSGVLQIKPTGGNNAFAFYGTINGIGDTATALLGGSVLLIGDDVSRANSRANGCLIGASGGGCLDATIVQPNLNLFDTSKADVFRTADDLALPIDPLVGTSNESLFSDIALSDDGGCPAEAGKSCDAKEPMQ